MKTIKRLIAITLALTLTLGFSVTTYAGLFTKKQLSPVTEYSYYWDGDDLSLYLKPVEGATQYNLAQLDGNTLYSTSNEMFISKKQLETFKTNNIIHIEVQAQSNKKNVNPSTWSKIDIKTVDWAQIYDPVTAAGLSHTSLQGFFNYNGCKNRSSSNDGHSFETIEIHEQPTKDDYINNAAGGAVNNLDGQKIKGSANDAAYESAMNGDSLWTMIGNAFMAGIGEALEEGVSGAAKGATKTYMDSKTPINDTIVTYAFSKKPGTENRSAISCMISYPVAKNTTPDLKYFKYNPNTDVYYGEGMMDPVFNRKFQIQISKETINNQLTWVVMYMPISKYAQYFKTK